MLPKTLEALTSLRRQGFTLLKYGDAHTYTITATQKGAVVVSGHRNHNTVSISGNVDLLRALIKTTELAGAKTPVEVTQEFGDAVLVGTHLEDTLDHLRFMADMLADMKEAWEQHKDQASYHSLPEVEDDWLVITGELRPPGDLDDLMQELVGRP